MKFINHTTIYKVLVLGLVLPIVTIGCKDNLDPVIEELKLGRVLTPDRLEVHIRNRTTIELEWGVRDDADYYVVEFSQDSLEFNTIIREVVVLPEELPLQEGFFGDTRYSARVKGVNEDSSIGDSNWAAVTVLTESENIFLPIEDGDISTFQATVRWPANSDVSKLVVNPGNIEHVITAGEKTAGVATITGLSALTEYTVQIIGGESTVRGTTEFKTLVDPAGPNTTFVQSTDDLNAVIAAAPDGQTLVLGPGDYLVNDGETLVLDKNLIIRGQLPYDRPMLHVQFDVADGAFETSIIDLEMIGDDGVNLTTLFDLATAGVDHTSINISGCYIHNYGRQLVYGNVAATLGSFNVDNTIIKDFKAGGGDFIDFRKAFVSNISLTNSTFVNTPAERDFIRTDAASGYTGTGLTTNILIDHCTLYGVSDATRRLLYVRFDANASEVTNCLFAETTAYYSNQSATSIPSLSHNNYFNAPGFYTDGTVLDEGEYTTVDPGFIDAENGDFTVTNQDILDDAIGDPRWLQ
ncbi:MAG: DUF4957 domain-containing protein [Cyclobacteriaceae bacterium]|nr:DUF4957 domain-containing protein [Cyclobacteriaceae bacterium]